MEAGSTKQLVRDGLFSLKTEVKMETGKCGLASPSYVH